MSPFQLNASQPTKKKSARFSGTGYLRNPFPESGVGSTALYRGHMPREIAAIDSWLSIVDSVTSGPTSKVRVQPLALEGSLGTGKTHVLSAMWNGLDSGQTGVLRVNLTQKGGTRLLLSRLLLDGLRELGRDLFPPAREPETAVPLVELLVLRAASDPDGMTDALRDLSMPLLGGPLRHLLKARGDDARELSQVFAKWLLRVHTTPSQRARLDIAHPLEAEGEAISAIAELMTISHAVGLVRCWYIFIDQLEELWRPGVVGQASRAKFLTDVRHMVDLALEGAPIATVLAWNTRVALLPSGGTQEHLKESYRALWQRLGEPVALPGLTADDVWPFAEEYLGAADQDPNFATIDGATARQAFKRKLKSHTTGVLEALMADPEAQLGGRLTARATLRHWRRQVDETVPARS